MKQRLDSFFISTEKYVQHASALLREIASAKNKDHIRQIVQTCKQSIQSSDSTPMHKLCSAKMIKDMFDLAIVPIIREVEQNMLIPLANVIEYRCQIKNIQRGSTLFLQGLEKTVNFQQLVRKQMSLSNSYFVLVHECMLHWAKFIPDERRKFKGVYDKLVRYCTFPKEHKYFKPGCVQAFQNRLKEEQEEIEYQLQQQIQMWQQTLTKMAGMLPSDNLSDTSKLIHETSLDCEDFALNYLDRLTQLNESRYYEKDKLKRQFQRVKKEMKEFFDLEKAARETRNYVPILTKYFAKEDSQVLSMISQSGFKVTQSSFGKKKVEKAATSNISPPFQRQASSISKPPALVPEVIMQQQPAASTNQSPKSRRTSSDFIDVPTKQPKPLPLDLHSIHSGKAKKITKSPKNHKNIPTYRSVVYTGKESFSMAECDTAAIDTIREVGVGSKAVAAPSANAGTPAAMSKSGRGDIIMTKTSLRAAQTTDLIIERGNAENISPTQQYSSSTVPLNQQMPVPNQTVTVKHEIDKKKTHSSTNLPPSNILPPPHRTQSINQTVPKHQDTSPTQRMSSQQQQDQKSINSFERECIKEENELWKPHKAPVYKEQMEMPMPNQHISASSFRRKSMTSQRTVQVSIIADQNTHTVPLQKKALRFNRLKAIKIESVSEKESIGIQAADTKVINAIVPSRKRSPCDYHVLYDISISKTSSSNMGSTDHASCQTQQEYGSVQLGPSTHSPTKRRNSLSTRGQRSSSLRKFSYGCRQNVFPEDSMLGLLHNRRAAIL